ncbi:MAG: SLC13 family permease, partial [Fidelibacterota bacterium]
PFRMFEFTKLGLIFLAVGTIYNMILAKWMLPSRSILSSLATKYHLGRYITEFSIGEDSFLVGKTYSELEQTGKMNADIIMIIRDNVRYRFDLKNIKFRTGDVLLVRLDIEDIIRFKEEMGLLLLSDVKLTQQELSGKNHVLVETIVSQNSSLIGKTLKEFNFRQRIFGFVLAVRRHGENLYQKIAHIRLKFSDTLLIMIPKEKLNNLREDNDLIVVEELDISLKYEKYWWLSILVIPLVMILAALNIIPLVKGAVLGTVILLMLRSLSIEDAYESINWPVIFMIAALVPIGIALRTTGTDVIIGKSIIYLGELFMSPDSPNYVVMVSLIYLVSFTLSAFISNTAIAIVMTPIAIALAHSLGIDSRPFLVAVAFGSSASFMTPMGYQTNLMVYGSGQYRFWDFIKAGFPLTIIFWGIATYYIPKFWNF